jgi:hypothetical protein
MAGEPPDDPSKPRPEDLQEAIRRRLAKRDPEFERQLRDPEFRAGYMRALRDRRDRGELSRLDEVLLEQLEALPLNVGRHGTQALSLANLVRTRRQEIKREQADLEAAIEWLREKWGDHRCPYCDHLEWQVGTPAEIQTFSTAGLSPTFPVMCGNCGQTVFVNAILAGLRSEPE